MAVLSGVLDPRSCSLLVPGVFDRTWRPSILLRDRFLGVPLDVLLYGIGSGFAATVFPAWAFKLEFTPLQRPDSREVTPHEENPPLPGTVTSFEGS